MPFVPSLCLLALALFAVYRQTRVDEVAEANRFIIALAYAGLAGIGLATSGWMMPKGAGWAFFWAGIVLSMIVGVLRGVMTPLWIGQDGRRMRKGTVLTVGLFLAMLAAKIGLGLYARLHGLEDGADFSAILFVVAIMVAAQAEIVFRRANMLASHR